MSPPSHCLRRGRPSPFSRRAPFPPVAGRPLADERRGNLYLEAAAELPQLLGRPGVLEENTIDLEGIQLAGAIAIDSLSDVIDQRS